MGQMGNPVLIRKLALNWFACVLRKKQQKV